MNLLLDTHVFIWWSTARGRLSSAALAACQDSNNTLVLSVASVWEMQIKLQTGKLTVTSSLDHLIQSQQRNSLRLLPVLLPHVYALAPLPAVHKDPFDRLLVAQAVAENLTLVSHDSKVALYPVNVLW